MRFIFQSEIPTGASEVLKISEKLGPATYSMAVNEDWAHLDVIIDIPDEAKAKGKGKVAS